MNGHAHGYGFATVDGRANGNRAAYASDFMQTQKAGSGRSRSYDGDFMTPDRRRASYTRGSTLPTSQSQTLSYASVQSQLKARRNSEGGEPRSKASGRSKRESKMVVIRPKKAPGELFGLLPTEVLECILVHLRASHRRVGSLSCETCWLRDGCSLGLTSRKWRAAVRPTL